MRIVVSTMRAREIANLLQEFHAVGIEVEAANALRNHAKEVDRLREFAAYVMARCAPTRRSIQDKAEALGLIELRSIAPEDSIDGETEHFLVAWKERP